MTNVITLPTNEEVLLTFSVNGTTVSIDPVEANDLVMAALDLEQTTTGKQTNEGWRKFFVSLFNDRFGITITEFQAWAITEKCSQALREWKKKLFQSPEPSSSTDSPVV